MIRKLLLLSAIVAAIALAAVWASPRDSEATMWSPFFGPSDFYRLDPATTSANPDLHAQFNVFEPSANFSGLFGRAITFGDSDVFVASAADIPNTGAYIGSLSSVASLGLANEGCNSTVPVTFDFVESNVLTTARPFTPNAMTVGAGGIAAAADDALTDFTYSHTGDPLGLKAGADGAGLGTAPEGTIAAAVNEIRVTTAGISEEMLVVGVDTGTNQYRVIRGWNGTATAEHFAGDAVSRVAVIYPNGPGTNLLANLGEDDGDLDNNGTAEEVLGTPGGASFNGNQVSDGADAVPSFVRDSQDPDNNADNGGYVASRARYAGVAFVASALIVILQFSIMDVGALTVFPNLSWATAAWGYSSVTFLQDPLAPASDSAITDFCNFSSNTFLYGQTHDNACTDTLATPPGACTGSGAGFTLRLAVDGGGPCGPTSGGPLCSPCPAAPVSSPNECGSIRSTNPPDVRRVRYYQYSVSQRDYDNDNHENALDTCPYHYNPSWDPREFNLSSGGDTDGDGLPNACDPAPAVSSPNHDGDGTGAPNSWVNRIDNCPALSNTATVMNTPNERQFDQDTSPGVNVYDGGPNTDSIGPECDLGSNTCTTAAPFDCPVNMPSLVSGTTPGPSSVQAANGHYHAAYAAQIICIGAANSECDGTPGLAGGASDPDGDGVVNASDTCRGGANPPTTRPLGNAPAGSNAEPAGPVGGDSTVAVLTPAGSTGIQVTNTAGFTTGSPIAIRDPLETLRYITAISTPSGPGTLTINAATSAEHQAGDAVQQVSFAQGSRDLNNSGFADTGDMALISGVFGTNGGNPALAPGYQGRYDINSGVPSNAIDTGDMAQISGVFGAACGPP